MFKLASTIIALALANSALAKVYITNPVASTNAIGGQVLNVKWADDGQSPTVGDIGVCTVDLYTGSVNQQTFLQNLAASVDVSKTSQISATIDPTVGQAGPYYFVRFASHNLKDTTNPQYPYQAYSAKFDINDMSGQFNATVMAQISADPNQPSTSASLTQAKVSASASKTGSGALTAASASASTGSAAGSYASPAGALVLVAGLASYLAL